MEVVPRERESARGGERILGIIPAIEAARECRLLTRTILSTDDEEIRETALKFGADVPFLRPRELSRDDSPAVEFVQHALGEIERDERRRYDYLCVLEPTAPFRTSEDIDAALSLLLSEGTDSVIGLTPEAFTNPARLRVIREHRVRVWFPELWKEGRRQQDLEQVYRPAGGLFACTRDVLVQQRSLHGRSQCGYVFPPERAVDIDTYFDLALAEFLFGRRGAP